MFLIVGLAMATLLVNAMAANEPAFASQNLNQYTPTYTTQTAETLSSNSSTVILSSTAPNEVSPTFSLTASPSIMYLPPGNFAGTTNFTLTVSSLDGWSGLVQFAASGLPPTVTISNLPLSYWLGSGGIASWNVLVNIGPGTQAGNYQLAVTGVSGSVAHSTDVIIIEQSYPVPEYPGYLTWLAVVGVILTAAIGLRKRVHETRCCWLVSKSS